MTEWILQLPTWEMIRFFGLLSYYLLFAGVVLGISYSFPGWTPKTKGKLYRLHGAASVSGMFIGVLHAMLLVIDTYMPFSWYEILLPFAASHSPVVNGLGTLAAYGMAIIILTTDLRNKLHRKVWRVIHFASYPTFVLALAHGIGGGTDTKVGWIFLSYVVTFAVVSILLIARAFLGGKRSLAHSAGRR
ncbi:ferric reductase-like transmembrane domain-containing protein [Brevibacillus centrosporus]|uniref:ferric reductase-like transmembrane domain-containing protein n=1 Tax=Brevibacillus centrosporus TaxID=54910 RepID=UPI002E1D32B7|nr:ferric reductase-like transmembrane domain-containing protein [Brevibacillus centrosporus]